MRVVTGRAATLPALFLFSAGLWGWQRDDLAALSQKAKALMSAGRFEDAIPICRQLVKAAPGNSGLLLNLALAQHMAGHEQDSIPNFEAVLKTQPKSLPALLSLGAARLSLSDTRGAVSPLQRAINIDSSNLDARGMLAGALMDLGRFEQASEQFRSLTDQSPDDPRAWYGLGMSYQGLSTKAFDHLKTIDTTSPYVAALVADTRVQTRQFRSAFFFYQQAAKALPQLHGIHSAVAEVYRRTGHAEWAASEDAKERSLPPPDCQAHAAECQFLGGHDVQAATRRPIATANAETLYWLAKAANELALQAFFRLGQLPESPELHRLRAEIARDQGKHLEAAKEWRAVLAIAPHEARAQQELAVSLFQAQDYRAAIAEAEPLLQANPKSAELQFVIGDSWLRLEEPEKAIPHLKLAIANDPNMLPAHASFGLALARVGQNKEAASHLEKAIELDEDGSLHYQLARAYAASGETERGRTVMQKYQEILKRIQQQKDDVAREAQIGPPQ